MTSNLLLPETPAAVGSNVGGTVRRAVHALMLVVSGIFLALHALHLNADFPNYSPWMDWSKYTDEGWYGDAAIRHFQRGHWYVPGDFNPAAALPVWPLLESAVFRFAGVNVAAARALTVVVFGLILVASYLLIRRWARLSAAGRRAESPSLAPAIGVLLLAVSPFCYVFTRLAILEPLLILLTLLALLVASYVCPLGEGGASFLKRLLLPALLGLLVTLMVLTKTTAVFLLPAIGWLLWARAGFRFRPFLRLCLLPGGVAVVTWLAYYFVVVHPHFLLDYQYLFSANAYTGITASTAVSIFASTIADGFWIGHLVFPLALLAILIATLNLRLTLRNPLVPALLFWAAGYTAFLAYHNNLQPRYYLVIAVPLTLLVPIVFESLWRAPALAHSQTQAQAHPLAAAALIVALAATVVMDARQTLHYVRTPEYTFARAAAQIQQIIAADRRKDPSHNPLVLSISGSNLSLMTGLPSICDDFGTMELPTRVATYRPGWFVTWNQVDDDKMDALTPLYRLDRVASFPVMDDPERNLLILYRLDAAEPTPPKPRRRKPIPRLLQTKIGQQPSTTQLVH
ncbi:hypothetical protein [Granulicella sp. dw_53]|uniref:hypothetical protein n=1 Tax=Granulicella sp. dw_53 TaxID=2719792 RepID=UPI002104D57A|nr:hypothetical protein [Granulicella sp. dw_53]